MHFMVVFMAPFMYILFVNILSLVCYIFQAIMFWIVDNFLMKKIKPKPQDLHVQPVRYHRMKGGDEDSESDVALISIDDDYDGLQQRHVPPSPTLV